MTNHFGHGTGALKLPYDWRDRQLARYPGVAAALATFPDSFSLRQYQTGPAFNQGAEPSCVGFSSAHLQAFYESMERGKWLPFNGHQLYIENGGDGIHGVQSRTVLEDMRTRGAPTIATPVERYLIDAYAFVDFSDFDLAIRTLKAAVAAKHPCVLAMLLPSDFMSGATVGKPASTVMTNEYHQVLIAQYDESNLGLFNSWGPGFGDNGWANISIDYLARPEQRGFLYAFTSVDAVDPNPVPVPPPPPPGPVPIITSVKYKQGNKLIVNGSWQDGSTLSIDGNAVQAIANPGQFVVKNAGLAPGPHVITVRGPSGIVSVPVTKVI